MWTTETYQKHNLPEITEMAREHYGNSWVSDGEFLNWQYEKNPAGKAVIRLARDVRSGRLAGQTIVIPMRFKTPREVVGGTLCLNLLTREAYRGQGIFTGLATAVNQACPEQGLDFCYAFPNPNSYPGFIHKLGFTDLGRVPLLLFPLNPKALVQKKIGAFLAPLALPFHSLFRIRDVSDARYEVCSMTDRELGDFDDFWDTIKDKYPLMGVRNSAYMGWRYFDIPLRHYQLYGVRKKGGSPLLGYIVGRCTDVSDLASGMIVDFLVNPDYPETGRLLLSHLLGYFSSKKMELAGALMLPHTEEFRILKAHRFFTCPQFLEPQPFRIVYRRFLPPETEDFFLQLNNWFLTMGDYDVI